ncbi:AAA family ATPase [Leptolyngbya sp. PCC 6406]|uniref:AAA family ATPase n=1 Tax=Leptolyngbya sp. PCC 6406 TaxID=1173264 RepID=UPI0002ACE479|nr:AAA family ATPase [Leptolyngbya sp. PCC 6406]
MGNEGAQPFANNWAYLKTELHWLDRLLLLAVSRQRGEDKVLSRVVQTEQDRVTSHWWKGIVTLPRSHPHEEGPPPKPVAPGASYSQQLETRIQASQSQGIILALPTLRDHYTLTGFEKNLMLLALAPEINRRYGRLYDYLQGESGDLEDLPTVDLCLRLLCRNDQAWQAGRSRLVAPNSLAELGLVEWIGDEGTLLSQQVRLTEPVVNYLLAADPPAEVPDTTAFSLSAMETDATMAKSTSLLSLESMTAAGTTDATVSAPRGTDLEIEDWEEQEDADQDPAPGEGASAPAELESGAPTLVAVPHTLSSDWDALILPKALKTTLQSLGRQGLQRQRAAAVPGLMVLLVGPAGTGKTTAATAIATDMDQALAILDLATVAAQDDETLLESALVDGRPLLVQGGDRWLGRLATADPAQLYLWWQQRQRASGLTLVAVTHLQSVRPQWRQRFDSILTFPRPDKRARQQIWSQVWSPDLNTSGIDWSWVAQELPLTGGEIQAIACTVGLELQARDRTTLTLKVLREAVALHHPALTLN